MLRWALHQLLENKNNSTTHAYAGRSKVVCQFILRQFLLISPRAPVRVLMLPIFIIDAANCLKNACRVPYYYDLRFDKTAVVTVTLPEHVIFNSPFQPLHP